MIPFVALFQWRSVRSGNVKDCKALKKNVLCLKHLKSNVLSASYSFHLHGSPAMYHVYAI